MSGIIAAEWSYRIVSDDDDATDWVTTRVEDLEGFDIPDPRRGATYEIKAIYLGPNGEVGDPLALTYTVPTTNKEGPLALPGNVVFNQASGWDGETSVEYEATTDGGGDSEALISVSAGDLVVGSRTISYGPSSGSVLGEAGTAQRVYLYYDDPDRAGGSRTLGITTDYVESISSDDRVAITTLLLEFPQIGDPPKTGGGGIGGGGGSGGAGRLPIHDVILE